jgi:hypothetical protein
MLGREERHMYKVFIGKPEGCRPLGKPRIILKWVLKTYG